MNPVVRTFLLVSAAYLLGGPVAVLADRDVREPRLRDFESLAIQKRPGAQTPAGILALPPRSEPAAIEDEIR